ncbi:MAG: peptidoglycan-associated lipoprotein Pal [Acidobacteria bacterium]|nr:peptidoglycan-associated lipoprotein Pal [Acidobacteriota bacterium]
MGFRKINMIPTMALAIALAMLLSGCPKRADVAKGDTPASGAQPGAAATSPSKSPGASRPGDPSRSPTGTVTTKEEVVTSPGQAQLQEPPAPGSPSAKAPGRPGMQAAAEGSPLKDIFFDFDKSNIRDDAKGSLSEDGQWLRANPMAQITIEGHCDERGTAEYNLGLGERRAKATRDYLIAAGIDAKRVKLISYGKERPFVLGHDESAWKWNRRAHFVVR